MKYCAKCGNELIDEAIVCTKCGCMVESAPQIYKPKPAPQKYSVPAAPVSESNVSWITLVFGILSLILFVIFFYNLFFTTIYSYGSFAIAKLMLNALSVLISSSITILTGLKNIAAKKTMQIIGLALGAVSLLTFIFVVFFGIR